MVTQGGLYMFELFNWYSAGISVLILAFFEVTIITYNYGFKKFIKHISDDMGIWIPLPLYYYWAAAWHVLTPVSLILIFAVSVFNFKPAYVGDYVFEANIQALGWFITFSSVICIPIFAGLVFFSGKYKGKELITAKDKFCPAHVRTKRERDQQKGGDRADGTFKYIYDNEGYNEPVATVYPKVPNQAWNGQDEKNGAWNGGHANNNVHM